MKIRKPSFSAIDLFTRCPMEYAREMVAGKSPPTKAMRRGTHLHDSLELAAKGIVSNSDWDWQVALSVVSREPPKGEMPTEEIRDYLRRALPIVKDLVPVKGGVEAWFDDVGPACGLPSLPICGKIDLISETSLCTSEMARPFDVCDGPSVIDYKTISREEKIKTSWEVRRSMQLKIYGLATGLTHAGFVYFPPKTDARAMFVEFSQEDLEIAHNYLTRTLDAMLSCWCQFTGMDSHEWGETISDDWDAERHGDWSAWPLCHADNYLCSKKWCTHFDNCIGAKSAQKGTA